MDRRELLATAPVAALSLPALAVGAPVSADVEIERAWARHQTARNRYRALPFDDHPDYDSLYSPQEEEQWAIIEETGETIRSAVAHTPRGVAIQIMVALYYTLPNRADEEDLIKGNLFGLLSRDEDQKWNARMLFSALRSLAEMQT